LPAIAALAKPLFSGIRKVVVTTAAVAAPYVAVVRQAIKDPKKFMEQLYVKAVEQAGALLDGIKEGVDQAAQFVEDSGATVAGIAAGPAAGSTDVSNRTGRTAQTGVSSGNMNGTQTPGCFLNLCNQGPAGSMFDDFWSDRVTGPLQRAWDSSTEFVADAWGDYLDFAHEAPKWQSKAIGKWVETSVELNGGKCRIIDGMRVCVEKNGSNFAFKEGTTYGTTFVTKTDPSMFRPNLLVHEKYHRDQQWNRFGLAFAPMYLDTEFIEVIILRKKCNRYEYAAETASNGGGGYGSGCWP
jgi:hypothetical protein